MNAAKVNSTNTCTNTFGFTIDAASRRLRQLTTVDLDAFAASVLAQLPAGVGPEDVEVTQEGNVITATIKIEPDSGFSGTVETLTVDVATPCRKWPATAAKCSA